MKEKLNKYYVLIKYGFLIEQLQEMSEHEIDMYYNQILKQI
jgi:hypothetical protein